MAKGGVSGAVDFPDYIENTHRLMLFGQTGTTNNTPGIPTGWIDIIDVLDNSLTLPTAGNPFDGTSFVSPSAPLADTQTKLDAYFSAINPITTTPVTYNSLLDAIVARAVDGNLLQEVDVGSLSVGAGGSVKDRLENFHNNFLSGIDAKGDYEELIDAILSKLRTSGAIATTSVGSIIQNALQDSINIVEESLSLALEAANSMEVTALLDAFEARVETAKQRNLREFHSGMADINAIHSTAFIWGNALIESEATKEIAAQKAEIQLRLFEASIALQGNLTNSLAGVRAQVLMDNTAQRNAILTQSINAVVQMLMGSHGYKQAMVELFGRVYSSQLTAETQGMVHNSQQYAQAILSASKDLLQMIQFTLSAKENAVRLQAEVNRMKIVAFREHEDAELNLSEKHALWPYEVYHRAANILAAPAGMSAPLPGKGSAAASALSGALTGGAMGAGAMAALGAAGVTAATGGLALPVIGIAAALGGLAGLL